MSLHLPLLPRQMFPLKHKVLTTPCSLCSRPDHNLAINCLPFSLTGGVPSHRETYCTVRGRSSSKGEAVHHNGTYVGCNIKSNLPPSFLLCCMLWCCQVLSVALPSSIFLLSIEVFLQPSISSLIPVLNNPFIQPHFLPYHKGQYLGCD